MKTVSKPFSKTKIIFEDVELYVNPTEITVKKAAQVADTKTFGGVVFQHWPDLPDVLSIDGAVFGTESYEALKYLKEVFHLRNKEVNMWYKGAEYKGFFRSFEITAVANFPGKFEFSLEFVLKNPPHFKIEDFGSGFDENWLYKGTTMDDFTTTVKNLFTKLDLKL